MSRQDLPDYNDTYPSCRSVSLYVARSMSTDFIARNACDLFKLIRLAEESAAGRQFFVSGLRVTRGKDQFYERPTSADIVGQL
jgi:hypothetical protein